MNKTFELFKLKNIIKKNGKEFAFRRCGKNEFGEDSQEYTDVCVVKGIYHETSSYVKKVTDDGASYTTKKSPMVLSLYDDCREVLAGDMVEISEKTFKVTEINNMGQEDIVVDISLEVV